MPASVELVLLGMIWGSSFLFMRIAARDFGAVPLVETRLVLGALMLLPFLWGGRTRMTARLWLRFAGIAAANSAIPFSLFAWAAERAPAGIGAITNAMAVMFTALWGFVLYREHISRLRLLGLLAGFAGVAVLAIGRTAGADIWQAALAGATAAMLYGLGLILARHYLSGLPSGLVAAANLTSGAVLLAPLALYTWPSHPIPLRSWVCVALLGVMCTGIAFVLYFRLIARIGPHRASTVTYLVPLFAVLWAYLALHEPLTPTMAVAGLLILAGVALSQREASRR